MADTSKGNMSERARGMFAPIPAVFDGKGEPDLGMMEQLTDWYINAGAHGFFVLGSQGQGAATTIDQRKAIAETVVKRVAGRVPVIVQVGAVDPYTSCELGAHAKSIGADAIGIVGPYYYSDRSEWELIEQHKQVDAATGLPILLYNNPQYSGYPTPPAMMKKLKEACPNVFGSKLANGNLGQAKNYLRTLGDDFVIFVPISNMLPGMLVGVAGSIAAGAPVTVPEAGVALVEAIWAEDYLRAQKLQVLLIEHADRTAVLRQYGRRTTFEGLRIRGLDVKEYPRWTTKPMTAEHLKYYEDCIKRLLDELAELTPAAAAAQ
ncbi:MAG: dihydrodipicolinate synthase family protein [Alphaproteobacteria bacterium]|nr:dihydrodipicolinate synthase family protein [Alphaproteobacteria bacterium]